MTFNFEWLQQIDKRVLSWGSVTVVGIVTIALALIFQEQWLPDRSASNGNDTQEDDPTQSDSNLVSLELSPQAQKNIGLTTVLVKPQTFQKTISMPAMVVERPGRSQVEVTAPLGGAVTRVYPIQGEAVDPGKPLFELRLTHEELVQAQSEFLRAAEELRVVMREITRLESVSITGAIPGKTLRQREYEKQKLEAVLNAQQQSLILHGLTPEQVKDIKDNRKLRQGLTVVVPDFPPNGHTDEPDHPFHIQDLTVKPGQYVAAGERLCVLADHHELWIEGNAFEQDADSLTKAANKKWQVSASLMSGGSGSETITGLKIFNLSDVVETASRAYHFYVRLPNRIVRDTTADSGHRFVNWQYKPGQRMQVHVPVDHWDNCIVLPVDAVAQEGAETFVFEQNGDFFDRVTVHVEYRDQRWVVIENDGKLVGSTVASTGAHQIQMALKNKSGGAVDPHAGHSH